MKIIKRGAEAILYLEDNVLVKDRLKKNYRIKKIDEKLRRTRTKKESNLIQKANRTGVSTPRIISTNRDDFKIRMEFIEGKRLKELLNDTNGVKRAKIAELVGKSVGLLHKNGIIHGDLTTSNMIFKDEKVYFIDFGLGDSSRRVENQAVDISVLKEAFKSTHFKYLNVLWENFIKGYKQTNDNFNKVLGTLNDIEKRGRYVER